jgi:probable F420-dependent oxidoreductase
MKPFTFLADALEASSIRELGERARAAEDLGVTTLVLPDHLVPQLSPVPYLATVAALTTRLRISAFVHNNDLRHPAVLAQDLASLDVLSGGRLDVAIGAGWNEPEYRAVGLRFDPIPVRQARLAEAVTVIKGCFGPGPFSFAGEHYTITDYDAGPKPVQRPHPPLFIGGGGRRTLSLAGREADIVGISPRLLPGDQSRPAADWTSMSVAAAAEKIGWVRAAAGDRFDAIELNTYPSGGPVQVTDDALAVARERADDIRARTGLDLDPEEILDSPHVFIGTAGALADKVLGLRERLGITAITVDDIDGFAPVVERLAGR